jgi:hypothetical protein
MNFVFQYLSFFKSDHPTFNSPNLFTQLLSQHIKEALIQTQHHIQPLSHPTSYYNHSHLTPPASSQPDPKSHPTSNFLTLSHIIYPVSLYLTLFQPSSNIGPSGLRALSTINGIFSSALRQCYFSPRRG